MYIIIGLGNPEPEYSNTRHNMGFDVINKLAKEYDISLNRTKFNAIYGTGIIEGEKVILIKPQTFMNNSGEAVEKFIKFYKESLENLLIIYDDMDTDIGNIRVRDKNTIEQCRSFEDAMKNSMKKELLIMEHEEMEKELISFLEEKWRGHKDGKSL